MKIFRWFKKNTKYLPSIIALILTQVFVLSSFSVVLAQDDETTEPFLNAAEVFQEGQNATVYVTGDTMSSATTGTATRNSFFIDMAVLQFGTDSFDGGGVSAGVNRSDLSSSTRAGLINTTDEQVTALLYNPPGVDIPSHLARQWIPGADGASVSVLAADTGYSHLQDLGVEQVWLMFRNIAYVGFVLILVATGFMIMFRTKIGGQVAVTVMNSLPSILVGLVLVTFSFAIVGFAIDISRLVTRVIDNQLDGALPGFDSVPIGGPLQMARDAFGSATGATWATPQTGFLSGAIKVLVDIVTGSLKIILTVILGFVALYAAFKLFFTLVMSYIKIVMDLVLGPIYLLIGSLPGGKTNVTNWIKRLLVNSLVFPFVFLIINLFRYIGSPNITNPLGGNFSGFMGGGSSTGSPVIQLKGAIILAGYFVAASAPTLVEDIFQLKQSPGSAKASQDIQKSASKIPLVGGLFGS